jgi:hypothetical protein
MSLTTLTFLLGALGVALLPLSLGCLTRRDLWRLAAGFCGLTALVLIGNWLGLNYTLPLKPGALWSFWELGATRPLVAGTAGLAQASASLKFWTPITWLLGGAAFALLAVRIRRKEEATLSWYLLGQFLLVALLWLFYDRIAVGFVPAAIALTLGARRIVRPVVSIAAVALFALVSIVGMYNHLQLNGALWKSVALLQSKGATAAEINGGYTVDGWLQYAHPENAARDDQGNIVVPFVNSGRNLRYTIASSPLRTGNALDSIPYRGILRPGGAFYIYEGATTGRRGKKGKRGRR